VPETSLSDWHLWQNEWWHRQPTGEWVKTLSGPPIALLPKDFPVFPPPGAPGGGRSMPAPMVAPQPVRRPPPVSPPPPAPAPSGSTGQRQRDVLHLSVGETGSAHPSNDDKIRAQRPFWQKAALVIIIILLTAVIVYGGLVVSTGLHLSVSSGYHSLIKSTAVAHVAAHPGRS